MKKILCIIAILINTSCANIPGMTLPGQVKVHESSFDGSKEIKLEPVFVEKGWFKIGGFWNSKNPDQVNLVGEITQSIVHIESDGGLQFNIDDKITKLSSPDISTNFESDLINGASYKQSKKHFVTDIQLLKSLVDAHDVKVKLITADGYREGEINSNSAMRLKPALVKFLNTIQEEQNK
ncbi:MAG: hypothetical protein PQ612_05900 [Rickettsiales bacterium]|nr:hypothetical protein [Pseudomonadota bacterium]MDA0966856.1 hypothetical protein [Pseudomonadota bacterium]MDG4543531.1 hypothetical protein [Rickettsiales bacterium]MDG4545679.1 hypothetical protein [Rickettsiales bacterium]MDG4547548.1 hypothetical protein [Rickettsiales bacterium]